MAATFEKAITYVFAGRLIRNVEVSWFSQIEFDLPPRNFRFALPAMKASKSLMKDGEENFKLCRKSVGKFQVMPDKNFI